MNKKFHKLIITILVIYLVLCYTFIAFAEEGIASWYSVASSSNITASGEEFTDEGMTCASMDYPFGIWLKVTNIENGKFVIVKVNDRGGFKKYGRIIDLSKGAFEKIADLDKGLIMVNIERIK